MSAFAELLQELETLAKAMPAGDEDDAKIKAAAGDNAEGHAEPDGDADGKDKAGDGDGKDEDEGMPMGKSFSATIDGKEVEAVDGTELVKALIGKIDATETDMAKALGATVDLLKSTSATVKAQAESIALLKSQVAELGKQGVGRKTTLSITDKPVAGVTDMAKSDGLTAETLMAKANAAAEQGKITWREAALVDGALRAQQVPDSSLLSKFLQ